MWDLGQDLIAGSHFDQDYSRKRLASSLIKQLSFLCCLLEIKQSQVPEVLIAEGSLDFQGEVVVHSHVGE